MDPELGKDDWPKENPKEMTKKTLLKLISQFDTNVARHNVARYKVTICKSIAFLYSNEQT